MIEAPWTGDIGRYIGIGANLRGGATFIDTPGTPHISSFDLTSLRAYVELRVIPERLSLYIDERLAPGDANNAETYLRLPELPTSASTRRPGRCTCPSASACRTTAPSSASRPASISIRPTAAWRSASRARTGPRSSQSAMAPQARPKSDNGKQWSLRSEYVSRSWRAGASFNLNDFDVGSRRMQNVFAGLRTGHVGWLAEADYIVDTTERRSIASLGGSRGGKLEAAQGA